MTKTREQRLAESHDMEPVQGTVDVDIPAATLWSYFRRPNLWPRWNRCFFWARNRQLELGRQLIWCFQPIRPWYPYKMPAIAKMVELEEGRKVTWEVSALPGFYARHTYHVEDLGGGRSRFGSWEKATGWSFRLMKWFWVAHFTFVKDRSLEGARSLAETYAKTGCLDDESPAPRRYGRFWLALATLGLLLAAVAVGWFYRSFVRVSAVPLAPGVHAVMGAGGNSLVVSDAGQALVVDTKFGPGARWLRGWIEEHVGVPVKTVVNTHYHYDHTRGNDLYPGAARVAHRAVPSLMNETDGEYWASHAGGVPRLEDAVPDEGRTLRVGVHELRLVHPAPAHTRGDLYVFLPRENIVATGDIVFNGYYPFMDQPEGGTSIPGMVTAIREMVRDHPDATFLPGHGPLAKAADLVRYADYLEALDRDVTSAQRQGWTEDQAARRVRPAGFDLSILPSFHHTLPTWATAANNARWAYRLRTLENGRHADHGAAPQG